MREYGSQAVVWQTAINPVVALELLDEGVWKGTGVLGPEAFPPKPFLERLAELGSPHGVVELPARRLARRCRLSRRGGVAAASRRLLAGLRREQVRAVGDVFGSHQVRRRALDGLRRAGRAAPFRLAREKNGRK